MQKQIGFLTSQIPNVLLLLFCLVPGISEASKIVIGIHGLANKPDPETLSKGWLQALNEKGKCALNSDEFQLVYWADTRYAKTLTDDKSDKEYFNKEPYLAVFPDAEIKKEKSDPVVNARHALTELFGTAIEISSNSNGPITKVALDKFATDLGDYYKDVDIEHGDDTGNPYRETIRGRLIKALIDHSDKSILLIAHSMGSIIAYDVLLDLEQDVGSVKVDHFVTIGSPLGLASVKKEIKNERERRKLSLPTVPKTIKTSWVNQVDTRDPVGLDAEIIKDFKNTHGIEIIDQHVTNDYAVKIIDDNRDITYDFNAHKSYGYLRTSDMLEVVCRFLGR